MRLGLFTLAVGLVLVPLGALAQTPRPLALNNTVLVAAYDCQADQLDRADGLVREIAAPILNKHVAAGRLISWGYLGVYVGNQNNRTIYVWAADPVGMMQARQQYLPEINANPKFAEFVKICGSATITLQNLLAASPPTK